MNTMCVGACGCVRVGAHVFESGCVTHTYAPHLQVGHRISQFRTIEVYSYAATGPLALYALHIRTGTGMLGNEFLTGIVGEKGIARSWDLVAACVCVCVYVCVCVCVCVYAYIYPLIQTLAYTFTHSHSHSHIHTFTHSHTHTHTHIATDLWSLERSVRILHLVRRRAARLACRCDGVFIILSQICGVDEALHAPLTYGSARRKL